MLTKNKIDVSPWYSNAPLLMVEGNIGAGKSTFLKVIQKHLDIDAIFEPTSKWQHQDDENNLLHLFYKDTPRWAYTFQSYAFITRVQTIINYRKNTKSNKPQLLERSVYCDRYCFAKNCYESGLMTALEWQIYKEWFAWLAESYSPRPNGFIYLKTTPEKCHERICKRDRHEEDTISLDYLKSLHNRHEEWLIEKKEVMKHIQNIPTLILDCNEEFENSEEVQKKHAQSIANFIKQELSVIPTTQKGPSKSASSPFVSI